MHCMLEYLIKGTVSKTIYFAVLFELFFIYPKRGILAADLRKYINDTDAYI